jgi:hypothetical protein
MATPGNNSNSARFREEYDTMLNDIADLYIGRVFSEQKANVAYLKPLIKDMVALMFSLMENKEVVKRLRSVRAQRRKGGKDIDIVYIMNSPDTDLNNIIKTYAKGL